ncbi:MAG: type II toxin-antitoxin system RelB/DinJ family antitoxin [Clostridiales bacterium]|nr:type II toxin-antitoxin system RelB/DinJ family antitoxin [Clostridiales bacterium]
MAVKSANVTARVEPEIKREAEEIIAELGLSVSSVINSFYRQIILRKGIPYSLTLPTQPKAVSEMTKEEFDQMIGTGLAQAKRGESLPSDEVFDELLEGI